MPMNNRELIRAIRHIWKRIDHDLDGGGAFGVDWPTLRATKPHMARVLCELMTEGRVRGLADRKGRIG